MDDIKKLLKKTWHFIWHEDSVLSWIVNIVLAFILIKFIIYPGVGFVMGTSHPIVAVVSGSMEHKTVHPCEDYNPILNKCINKDTSAYWICDKEYDSKQKVDFDFFWKACGDWYEERGIQKEEFSDYSFKNGFNTGDIIFLRGENPKDIEVGDVIVFYATKNYPIIHRVVDKTKEGDKYYFTTKGDHNSGSGEDDRHIREENIIGKAAFKIPFVGWVKIGAYRLWQQVLVILT